MRVLLVLINVNFQCFTKKGMHFLHLNARSLLPKISELKLIAKMTRATVISVTETWLDSSVTDQEISIDNYCVARKDQNRNGGGVCTYIRNDVAFYIKNDISADQDEILWLLLHLPKTKPIIIVTDHQSKTTF